MTTPPVRAATVHDPTATAHAVETYAPRAERQGLALCLSGGGFRAALFHLGALRRLHEQGVLAQLDEVTSVSGGSITAALFARAVRDASGTAFDFERALAAPLRAFTARNIRTPALLRRLLPWHWVQSDAAARGLARAYAAAVRGLRCAELPARPNFTLCSTDMAFGVNFTFEREWVGDYLAGYEKPRDDPDVGFAVAASSCFPPVFDALHPHLDPHRLTGGEYHAPDRATTIRGLRLTDGGLYDNLGLEPVWKRCATVLVSDGGGPFEYRADQGLLSRLGRYSDLIYRQVGALRKRWLISGFLSGALRGTYWGIASSVAHYDASAGYDESLSAERIARIRTDLDAFSGAEAAILENHGYALADAALSRHVRRLIAHEAPFTPPHPEWDWTHPERVRAALARSDRRTLFGHW